MTSREILEICNCTLDIIFTCYHKNVITDPASYDPDTELQNDKYNYKGFVSAVRPSPPVLTLSAVNSNSVEISWVINVCYLLPNSSFNIYVNNILFINILNNNSFTTILTNLNKNDTIYITSLSTSIESEPSNIILY
jgi:hypothetical protein